MTTNKLPARWDEERVRRVLDHYENQTDEEAAAEDDERYNSKTRVVMEVPADLVPAIRDLIAKYGAV